jgi:hypothetical protein
VPRLYQRTSAPPPEKLRPFTTFALRRFYASGFEETDAHRRWAGLWRKQLKLRLSDGAFISLNKLRPRFSFQSLRRYSVRFAPVNLYMSALNWLMPERVAEKGKANNAYPIGGEYVVDVDHYLNYLPHSHRTTEEGLCEGCLENSKEISLRLLDAMSSNYSKFEIVFSGRRGFHIHALGFDPTDWTTFNEANPIKSHEVSRFIYTRYLKQVCGGFDDDHFKLSVDPLRVVALPDSINGMSGLLCKSLGGRRDFEGVRIPEVLRESRWRRIHNYLIRWYNMGPEDFRGFDLSEETLHAHLEPRRG